MKRRLKEGILHYSACGVMGATRELELIKRGQISCRSHTEGIYIKRTHARCHHIQSFPSLSPFLSFPFFAYITDMTRKNTTVEGDPDCTEVLEDDSRSIILDIIAQLRKGKDLHRVALPTFVLEPRSMLERITDFMSHPDLIQA